MSKTKLGAGLRAELDEATQARPAGVAASFMRARQGRPPEGPDGIPKSRNRALMATGEVRKAIIAYGRPEISKWLKLQAATEETTVNALILEAVDLLRRNRGEHPFGER